MRKKAAVVMGSKSDFPTVKKGLEILESLGIEYEVRVLSAHRTPAEACAFAASAKENGFGVIIAAAGMAAHLAGVLAAHTVLPVIGIPIKSAAFEGLDALLSVVQMPKGVPVATVAVDGAANAAVLAAQILALSDPALSEALESMKRTMREEVLRLDRELQAELNDKAR